MWRQVAPKWRPSGAQVAARLPASGRQPALSRKSAYLAKWPFPSGPVREGGGGVRPRALKNGPRTRPTPPLHRSGYQRAQRWCRIEKIIFTFRDRKKTPKCKMATPQWASKGREPAWLAQLGSARLASAPLSSARLGSARLASARLSSAGLSWLGSARLCWPRLGSSRVRLGSARLGHRLARAMVQMTQSGTVCQPARHGPAADLPRTPIQFISGRPSPAADPNRWS